MARRHAVPRWARTVVLVSCTAAVVLVAIGACLGVGLSCSAYVFAGVVAREVLLRVCPLAE